MEEAGLWLEHNSLTSPGRHCGAISGLPQGIGPLMRVIQGMLIHSDELAAYGIDATRMAPVSRGTLPVADRIDEVLKTDPRPPGSARSPHERAMGTCRDFALLLCSFLRSRGVPSRVRCGFAAYLGHGWNDHWVCEHWDRSRRHWQMSDPQLDDVLKQRYAITFDPSDIPRHAFQTAGEAWIQCRRGLADSGFYGHGVTTGLWFVKVNVIRDHLALNGSEISVWDRWREAPAGARIVGDHETKLLDRLAAHPELPSVDIVPDWLL